MKNLTIISGPPGSGKTTRLMRLVDEAKASGRRVVLVTGGVTVAGVRRLVRQMEPCLLAIDDAPRGADLAPLARDFPAVQFALTAAS